MAKRYRPDDRKIRTQWPKDSGRILSGTLQLKKWRGMIVRYFFASRRAARAPSHNRSFTWEQIQQKFESTNPTLKAAQMNIDESRANEITADLRPNPDISGTFDQINPFTAQPTPNGRAEILTSLRIRAAVRLDQLSARAAAQAGTAARERADSRRTSRVPPIRIRKELCFSTS